MYCLCEMNSLHFHLQRFVQVGWWSCLGRGAGNCLNCSQTASLSLELITLIRLMLIWPSKTLYLKGDKEIAWCANLEPWSRLGLAAILVTRWDGNLSIQEPIFVKCGCIVAQSSLTKLGNWTLDWATVRAFYAVLSLTGDKQVLQLTKDMWAGHKELAGQQTKCKIPVKVDRYDTTRMSPCREILLCRKRRLSWKLTAFMRTKTRWRPSHWPKKQWVTATLLTRDYNTNIIITATFDLQSLPYLPS